MDTLSPLRDPREIAVELALASEWSEAIKVNQTILKETPDDVDTLNRVAFAYSQIGEVDKAKKFYSKVLKIDEFNSIAKKNIERLSKGPHNYKNGNIYQIISPSTFLSEPGKTKIAACVKLAIPKILAGLMPGSPVKLNFKKHGVSVTSNDNDYLGALSDELAFLLIRLDKIGNTYKAFVKSASPKTLQIFIRETFKAKKMGNQQSFPTVNSASEFQKESKED